jgi:hypothetical protein
MANSYYQEDAEGAPLFLHFCHVLFSALILLDLIGLDWIGLPDCLIA